MAYKAASDTSEALTRGSSQARLSGDQESHVRTMKLVCIVHFMTTHGVVGIENWDAIA